MARPKLLMLDEPSLGLAPLIVREIFHIIADLKKTGVALEGESRALADDPRVVETYLGLGGKKQ
jgi:branched-chain amino acid transport system ATP-binding protein